MIRKGSKTVKKSPKTKSSPKLSKKSPNQSKAVPKSDTKKKELESVENEIENLSSLIKKAKSHIKRLRFEKRILKERVEMIDPEFADKFVDHDVFDDNEDSYASDSASINEARKSKKKKRKKDPDLPKRPANAYLMFCNTVRDQIKSENPELGRVEITRVLGERWKSLSDAEKQKFYEMFEEEKKRYKSDMKKYQQQESSSSKAEDTKEEKHSELAEDGAKLEQVPGVNIEKKELSAINIVKSEPSTLISSQPEYDPPTELTMGDAEAGTSNDT